MERKRFSTGTGRLTPEILNHWNAAADQVFNPGSPWEEIAWHGPVLAQVVDSTAMGEANPNRWFYDLQPVDFKTLEDMDQLVTISLGSTEGNHAINLAECSNTATTALGVTLDNLPEGFSLQPIPDDSLVWAYYRPFAFVTDSDDVNEQGFVAAFTQTNHFDGACP